jgi:hypothetical protein
MESYCSVPRRRLDGVLEKSKVAVLLDSDGKVKNLKLVSRRFV